MLGELQLTTATSTERKVRLDGPVVVVVQLVVEEGPETLDGCTAADHLLHYASCPPVTDALRAPDSIA